MHVHFSRFGSTQVCLCRAGGVSWSNSGLFSCSSLVAVTSSSYHFLDYRLLWVSVQPAKKIYENLLANDVNATALAHIQVMMVILAGQFLMTWNLF